jgi:hypothetical protein
MLFRGCRNEIDRLRAESLRCADNKGSGIIIIFVCYG